MPKLIIDDTQQDFTKSRCACSFCTSTHDIIDEWKKYYPKNNLQKRMLNVVKKIERKNKIKNK